MAIVKLKLGSKNFAKLFGSAPQALLELVAGGHGQIVLAGGAIRSTLVGEYPNDYDLFFVGTAQEAIAAYEEKLTKAGFKVTFRCPKGELTSFRSGPVKVQFITKRIYNSIGQLLNSFDFTSTMLATTDFSHIHTTPRALRDARRKKLRLNQIEYPVATLNRVQKYLRYGFKPCTDFYLDLARTVTRRVNEIATMPESDQHEMLALYVD